jgi:flagellum-specific peptidoglycan hydrolase FlgJ
LEQRKTDVKAVSKALKTAWYATDVAYARKLIDVSFSVEKTQVAIAEGKINVW